VNGEPQATEDLGRRRAMTTNANETSLHITAPRRHMLRDLALVAALLAVLGTFVAEIASGPSSSRPAPTPSASAQVHSNPRA
jgi:ferric-dicitrate binding protein FerR (iron transport regulator)